MEQIILYLLIGLSISFAFAAFILKESKIYSSIFYMILFIPLSFLTFWTVNFLNRTYLTPTFIPALRGNKLLFLIFMNIIYEADGRFPEHLAPIDYIWIFELFPFLVDKMIFWDDVLNFWFIFWLLPFLLVMIPIFLNIKLNSIDFHSNNITISSNKLILKSITYLIPLFGPIILLVLNISLIIRGNKWKKELEDQLPIIIERIRDISKKYSRIGLAELREEINIDKFRLKNLVIDLINIHKIKGMYFNSTKSFIFEKIFSDMLDRRKVLYGMIRTREEIDLNEAIQILDGAKKKEIKGLIYELAGDKRVEGRFEDEVFKIESDIEKFIIQLEKEFIEWAEKG